MTQIVGFEEENDKLYKTTKQVKNYNSNKHKQLTRTTEPRRRKRSMNIFNFFNKRVSHEQAAFSIALSGWKIVGEQKSCGKKVKYPTEDKAVQASIAHNKWKERKSDVEPYPCAFCEQWHIGGIMPIELLQEIIDSHKKN